MMGAGTLRQTRARFRPLPSPRSCGAEKTEFDPTDGADPDLVDAGYALLHAGGPLHYNHARRIWIISRHEDVRAGARSHDTLSSADSITPARNDRLPMMIAMDRPEHTRLRRIVARQFTHEAIDRRRASVEQIVRDAFDALPRDGAPFDAVERLSGPIPVEVIAQLLGIPREDRAQFRDWSDRVVVAFGVVTYPMLARSIRSIWTSTLALHAYLEAAIAERRRAPRDDLISHLIASSEEGRLTADELFWFTFLLLVAGNETTTSLIGGMLLAFARNPDQYARVREDPALIPGVVEESLRYVSPIQGLYRTALADHPVGDGVVPAGERVLLAFGAANRDPRRYPDPDRFLVERDASDHLAFGSGIHFCLGAQLARLEAAVFLEGLVERASAVEVAGAPVWTGNPALRALSSLRVRLGTPCGN
jgi:beta-dihydromenaquinone-9 omega-hydroxylase